MTETELIAYIEGVLGYLKKDIESYKSSHQVGAGPYLLTAFSGIDFLGSLGVPNSELSRREQEGIGLLRKSGKGSKWFLRSWMQRIRGRYGELGLADFLYKAVRCSQVHEGSPKPGVLIGLNHDEQHMKVVTFDGGTCREAPADVCVLYVQTAVFADDFLRAAQVYLEAIKTGDIDLRRCAMTRLTDHIEQEEINITSLGEIVQVGPAEFSEMYETSSASPHDPGGSRLL